MAAEALTDGLSAMAACVNFIYFFRWVTTGGQCRFSPETAWKRMHSSQWYKRYCSGFLSDFCLVGCSSLRYSPVLHLAQGNLHLNLNLNLSGFHGTVPTRGDCKREAGMQE